MAAVQPAGAAPRPTSSVDIVDWRPEDNAFWESTGKKIANRNLWISVPSLLCGFAVWLMWGIITVQMANLGFPFTQQQLFTLAAISGLSGATLRIPAGRIAAPSSGRFWTRIRSTSPSTLRRRIFPSCRWYGNRCHPNSPVRTRSFYFRWPSKGRARASMKTP